MEHCIVIAFRAEGGGPGRPLVERARELAARAKMHDGVMVGFDGMRVAFAFPAADPHRDMLPELLLLVATRGDETRGDEVAFGVGIAEGDLEVVMPSESPIAGGPALVAAMTLASAAQPSEVLSADSLRALRMGKLVTHGARIARDGALRIRGVRLDMNGPWRSDAVDRLASMRVAPLVGATRRSLLGADGRAAPALVLPAGAITVVRADPGIGGTRFLTELAASSPRALVLAPSGSGFEPLGALRRALSRSITRELGPALANLAEPLEQLLAGDGVPFAVATELVSAMMSSRSPAPASDRGSTPDPASFPPVILVDDAKWVDPSSLQACLEAMRGAAKVAMVVRLDATGGLPPALAGATAVAETELPPLPRGMAEELAGGCTNDALDEASRARWARLGGNVPLGVVEAIAYGIVTGDIAWRDDKAEARGRTSGRGKARSAAEWILLRARDESAAGRLVLGLVALLGGEAKVSRLGRVLARAKARVDVDVTIEELMRARWLVDTQEDWVALPSRTHRDTLVTLLEEPDRIALSAAAADVIREEEGAFGQVEAAFHAAHADNAPRASRILLAAAKRTGEAGFEASTTQLIAFARRTDPSCEDAAMEILADALAKSPSIAPPPTSAAPASARRESMPPLTIDTQHDSEPPTITRVDAAPPEGAMAESPTGESPPDGATIASRLGDLARDALLHADNAALERWVDGLRATGESPIFTERMRAMARLGRGDIGDALRVLRRTRSKLDPGDHRRRCQTSLAIGVALSAAGRPQEALLEGMDALARAKQTSDEKGAKACLAFLAKLYSSVQRHDEAEALRRA